MSLVRLAHVNVFAATVIVWCVYSTEQINDDDDDDDDILTDKPKLQWTEMKYTLKNIRVIAGNSANRLHQTNHLNTQLTPINQSMRRFHL